MTNVMGAWKIGIVTNRVLPHCVLCGSGGTTDYDKYRADGECVRCV